MKIVSLNARGLADKNKRQQILRWLESKNSKVIFLQETHSTIDTELFGGQNGVVIFIFPMELATQGELVSLFIDLYQSLLTVSSLTQMADMSLLILILMG